jgi:GNAT superfamily N-acetyltransferase
MSPETVEIGPADPVGDRDAVGRLWLAYLGWGNDELESRYGFRLPVQEAVTRDLAAIEKFLPPHGSLLLGRRGEAAVATASMQRIGPDTAEIKRMWVEPSARGAGIGGALLDALIGTVTEAGHRRIRLDSPDFMTAAHALYRSRGFVEISPYEESEIPAEHRSRWIFMELVLR